MAAASLSRLNEQLSIIAAEAMVPIGLARSRPAMSGALPWIGSYISTGPPAPPRLPRVPAGGMAIEAGSLAAPSLQELPEKVGGTGTPHRVWVRVSVTAP